jgi:hypothetical protein
LGSPSELQVQPILAPVVGSTLPHDLRNSPPFFTNIFIAIPANAKPMIIIASNKTFSAIVENLKSVIKVKACQLFLVVTIVIRIPITLVAR